MNIYDRSNVRLNLFGKQFVPQFIPTVKKQEMPDQDNFNDEVNYQETRQEPVDLSFLDLNFPETLDYPCQNSSFGSIDNWNKSSRNVNSNDFNQESQHEINNRRRHSFNANLLQGSNEDVFDLLARDVALGLDQPENCRESAKSCDEAPGKSTKRKLTRRRKKNLVSFKRDRFTSKYKGVLYVKSHGKWRAQLCTGGKKYCLGSYATEREAAIVRDKKVVELFGPKRELLNLPELVPELNNDNETNKSKYESEQCNNADVVNEQSTKDAIDDDDSTEREMHKTKRGKLV